MERPMKIGIDAKWYFSGPPSGIRVTQNLIHALLESDRENEYYLFLDAKFKHKGFDSRNAKVKCIYLWAGVNSLSNVFVLPWKANHLRLDVLMFQTFVSPFYKGKKVVYIFDVLFDSFPQFFTKKERLYFIPIKYLARLAGKIITLSEEEKKRLIRYRYGSDSKIEAIHIGVDDVFKPLRDHSQIKVSEVKDKYKLPDRFLLYVGRLNTRKNIETLIKALPKIKDQSIPLIIAGKEDWKRSNYRAMAEASGVMHRISFTGWTRDDELPIIYALATIFCFPSYAEGFGLPPLESMASGVPVIVSNATSLPEVCGDAAVYVSPDKPEEMVNAIDGLLEDDDLSKTKISKGITRSAIFTWEKTAKNIQEILLKEAGL